MQVTRLKWLPSRKYGGNRSITPPVTDSTDSPPPVALVRPGQLRVKSCPPTVQNNLPSGDQHRTAYQRDGVRPPTAWSEVVSRSINYRAHRTTHQTDARHPIGIFTEPNAGVPGIALFDSALCVVVRRRAAAVNTGVSSVEPRERTSKCALCEI